MSLYRYEQTKKAKVLDFTAMISIVAYFTLPFMFFMGDRSKLPPEILKNFLPVMLILGIVMFLMPFIQLTKRKRAQAMTIETGRKGLSITLFDKKNIYSWKDLTRSIIIYDTMNNRLYPRKIILHHGNSATPIDNPPFEPSLEKILDFASELTDNIPNIKQQVIGIANVCPWCGLYENSKKCPKCSGNIEYIPRVQKIFYYVKLNILLVAIAGMFMGKAFFIPSLILLTLFVLVPAGFIIREDKPAPLPKEKPGKK